MHTNSLGLVCKSGQDLGQVVCCQTCVAIPKVNLITLLPTQQGDREKQWHTMGNERKAFLLLWGLSMFDMEDYTGTKIALLACVVYALLVLRYYRLVLLSSWTIAGFSSTLCSDACMVSFFPPPDAGRYLVSDF